MNIDTSRFVCPDGKTVIIYFVGGGEIKVKFPSTAAMSRLADLINEAVAAEEDEEAASVDDNNSGDDKSDSRSLESLGSLNESFGRNLAFIGNNNSFDVIESQAL